MNIEIDDYGEKQLGDGALSDASLEWTLVVEGFWEEGRYHGGYIAYDVARSENGTWLLRATERKGILDGVTQEDVDEGLLNDDQRQAMWGMTLEEAQSRRYQYIAAVLHDAPTDTDQTQAALLLYEEIENQRGKTVSEVTAEGLLADAHKD